MDQESDYTKERDFILKSLHLIGIKGLDTDVKELSIEKVKEKGGYIEALIDHLCTTLDFLQKTNSGILEKRFGLCYKLMVKMESTIFPTNTYHSFRWIIRYIRNYFQKKCHIIKCPQFPIIQNHTLMIDGSKTFSKKEYPITFIQATEFNIEKVLFDHNISNVAAGIELWFHGTDFPSCEGILSQGIKFYDNGGSHDFGIDPAFYLSKSVDYVHNFTRMMTTFTHHVHLFAIIVFKVPSLNIISGLFDEEDNSQTGLNIVSLEDGKKWKDTVYYSLGKKRDELREAYPDVYNADIVHGKIPHILINIFKNNYDDIKPSDDYQIALKTEKAARIFEKYIHHILIYATH